MKWYWLLAILAAVVSIVQSDESKRKRWEAKAEDDNAPNVDRLGSLLVLALAIWQSIVLWSPQ